MREVQIIILLHAQRKAKKLGIVYGTKLEGNNLKAKLRTFGSETDLVGLLLLGATLALIFLPIVIAGGSYATTTWHDPAIPAMMVIGGFVTLPLLVYWETRQATHPVIPARLLANRTVMAACVINFFDFIS